MSDSTIVVAQTGVKYKCQVYMSDNSGFVQDLTVLKTTPNNAGSGMFDLRPIVTEKQSTLITQLETILVTPTFQEQFPDTHEDQFFNGRQWQREIARMRNDGGTNASITIEEIYSRDSELWDWLSRPYPKHNSR